jgi:hypothetical protein
MEVKKMWINKAIALMGAAIMFSGMILPPHTAKELEGIALAGDVFSADERDLQKFIDSHVKLITPLQKQAQLAYWEATQWGKREDYDRYADLSLAISLIHSNKDDFAKLQGFKQKGNIKDPLLGRQLELLYKSQSHS